MVERNEDRQDVTLRDIYTAVGDVRRELRDDIASVKQDMKDVRETVNHHLEEFQEVLASKADRDELLYNVVTRYAANPLVRIGGAVFLALLGAATFGEPVVEVLKRLSN